VGDQIVGPYRYASGTVSTENDDAGSVIVMLELAGIVWGEDGVTAVEEQA
jgi:hypothetical protein